MLNLQEAPKDSVLKILCNYKARETFQGLMHRTPIWVMVGHFGVGNRVRERREKEWYRHVLFMNIVSLFLVTLTFWIKANSTL